MAPVRVDGRGIEKLPAAPLHPVAIGIRTGHHAEPCGGAQGSGRVRVHEHHALIREPVDVRSGNRVGAAERSQVLPHHRRLVGAVGGDIRPPQVIRHDHDDVGKVIRQKAARCTARQKQKLNDSVHDPATIILTHNPKIISHYMRTINRLPQRITKKNWPSFIFNAGKSNCSFVT